jgi:leucyl aminopeptidase
MGIKPHEGSSPSLGTIMKFSVKISDPVKIECDNLVVFAYFGKTDTETVLCEESSRIDLCCKGLVRTSVEKEQLIPVVGSTHVVHPNGMIGAQRVIVSGLGDYKKITAFDVLTVGAGIGRKSKANKAISVAVVVSSELYSALGLDKTVQLLAEGIRLGAYSFTRHKSVKTKAREHEIEEVVFLTSANKLNSVNYALSQAEIISDGVCFARDLVNEPPSVTTPTYLSEIALGFAKNQSLITCEVLDRAGMGKLKMGAFLGIARGSEEEPRFIHLTYKGGGRKTIVLVGKGITFDSGGLSLKTSTGMESMKLDMAGAAVILGIFKIITELKLKVNVVGLIAACENMPSGKAVKPGDVLTSMCGKTIEILNTDAEGRVILADALSYAVSKIQSDVIIDLATLTGACIVALGEDIAGLFSNNDTLFEQLKQSAGAAGESVWGMPLAGQYKEQLKSTVADIKNISGLRYGGAINGALFLQEFVPDSIPWAHLDIAGPAYAEKDAPLTPVGGTGFGVRMILAYLLSL